MCGHFFFEDLSENLWYKESCIHIVKFNLVGLSNELGKQIPNICFPPNLLPTLNLNLQDTEAQGQIIKEKSTCKSDYNFPHSECRQAEPPITNSNVQGTQANRFQTQTQDSNPQVAPKTQSTFFSPFTAPSQHPEPEPTASFPVCPSYSSKVILDYNKLVLVFWGHTWSTRAAVNVWRNWGSTDAVSNLSSCPSKRIYGTLR